MRMILVVFVSVALAVRTGGGAERFDPNEAARAEPAPVSSPTAALDAAAPAEAPAPAAAPVAAKATEARQPQTWLAQVDDTAKEQEAARAQARSSGGYRPDHRPYWGRRGPGYPGDIWRTLKQDILEIAPSVWDDTRAVLRNKPALLVLGAAGIAGLIIGPVGWDGQVADHYRDHRNELNKCGDMIGDVGGNPGVHFALAGAMYFHSQFVGNTKEYEVSKTLFNALSINGLLTLGLKFSVHTDSPNDDPWGWPSGHTSSSFCFATVMHHAYGPWVGVPLFAFATFVGYERCEARNHDFSDVVSGALIGIAIGHAVAKNHEMKIFGMDIVPYTDSRGGVGVALMKRW